MVKDEKSRTVRVTPFVSPDVADWIREEAAKDRRKHAGEWVALLVEAAHRVSRDGEPVKVGPIEIRRAKR